MGEKDQWFIETSHWYDGKARGLVLGQNTDSRHPFLWDSEMLDVKDYALQRSTDGPMPT